MELKICHLYGDVLNLYGDRGNIITMKKRLEWRGIDCAVEKINPGQSASLAGCDLIFIGGGMEFDTRLIVDDLRAGRAAELKAAVEDGVSLLAICSGYQLLGRYCQDGKGVKTPMAGVLDMYTVCGKERMTGNKSYLSEGVEPLGKVLCGHGNNGEDGGEGARYKNLFGTYSYGPILPKNAKLCDHILLTALERKYGLKELEALNDRAENEAFAAINARLG